MIDWAFGTALYCHFTIGSGKLICEFSGLSLSFLNGYAITLLQFPREDLTASVNRRQIVLSQFAHFSRNVPAICFQFPAI